MDDANGLDGQHDGGDEHSVVMKLLTSENWQKRLEEARQSREKILAQKPVTRKPLAGPVPFDEAMRRSGLGARPVPAAPPRDATFPQEPKDNAVDGGSLPPNPVFRIGPKGRPALVPRGEPATALKLPTAPRQVPPSPTREGSTLLPALAPVAATPAVVPVTTGTAQQSPARGIGLRGMAGFGIGVLAGVGITTLLWMGRPDVAGLPGPVAEAAGPAVVTPRAVETAAPAETTAALVTTNAPPLGAPAVTDRLAAAANPVAPPRDADPVTIPLDAGPGPQIGQRPGALVAPAAEALPTGPAALSVPVVEPVVVELAQPQAEVAAAWPGAVLRPAVMVAPGVGGAAPGLADAAVALPDLPAIPQVLAHMTAPPPPAEDVAAHASALGAVAAAPSPVALRIPGAHEARPAPVAPPPPPVLAPTASQRPKVFAPSGTGPLDTQVAVKVLAPKALPGAEVAALASGLRSAGYAVGDPTPVGVKVSATHVRYYHPSDRASAETLALRFKGEARDFTGSGNQPPAGTIELWLQGAAPKATKAKPAKVKAKASGTGKAKVRKAPAEDPQVRALRERVLSKLKSVNKS